MRDCLSRPRIVGISDCALIVQTECSTYGDNLTSSFSELLSGWLTGISGNSTDGILSSGLRVTKNRLDNASTLSSSRTKDDENLLVGHVDCFGSVFWYVEG